MILLDTHVWLWLAAEPKKLSKDAASAIRRASKTSDLAVSTITLFEMSYLFASGRARSAQTVQQSLHSMIESTRVQTLQITPDIAAAAVQLPDTVPGDPADRLIVATALVHALPLVTRDARILDSGACKAIW